MLHGAGLQGGRARDRGGLWWGWGQGDEAKVHTSQEMSPEVRIPRGLCAKEPDTAHASRTRWSSLAHTACQILECHHSPFLKALGATRMRTLKIISDF